jgi:hypothetical protein
VLKPHAKKMHWEVDVKFYSFLTTVLGGRDWSASRSDRFTPVERPPPPGTHWVEGCVDPRAGLDAVMKRHIPAPAENRTPVVMLVLTAVPDVFKRSVKNKIQEVY